MTIKQLNEKHSNLINDFEDEMNKEDSDAEKLENLKGEIEEVSNNLENEKYLDEQRKARLSDQEKEEKFNQENDKDTFRFTEMLNYLENPMNVSAEKREFYGDVNSTGKNKAQKSGVSLQGGDNFVIPASTFRNAVDVSTEGSDVLFDQEGAFIEALREKMVLGDLGTRYVSGLTGDIRMPKQTKKSTFTWEGETTDADNKDTEYGNVKLAPKRGYVGIPVSNQMLNQQSFGMEQIVQDDIMNSVAVGVEAAAINSGGANSPDGILDSANEVTSGSDLYQKVVNLEADVTGANIQGNSYAYLMDTQLRADAKQATKDSGSGRFVWEQGDTVNGYPTAVTNNVADDQMIFGDFDKLVIGDFSGVEILKNPYISASAGITVYQVNVYMGVAIRHDEAFAYIDQSGT